VVQGEVVVTRDRGLADRRQGVDGATFRHRPGDLGSLMSDNVVTIYEDRDGLMGGSVRRGQRVRPRDRAIYQLSS
jgi:hypothetical protein